MSTIAKIKCGLCNRKFDYYFNLRNSGDGFTCPYCMSIMNSHTAHALRDVIGRFSELNMDMRRYAADRNDTLFQFDLQEIGE